MTPRHARPVPRWPRPRVAASGPELVPVARSGLVFNPATSLDILKYVMDKVDIVLLMSVNPGFGGQAFIPATLDKLREARKLIDESGYEISLEIDGGVGPANIAEVAAAGADNFVAGSAIFNTDDYAATIKKMRDELAKVPVPGGDFALY